MPSAHGYAAAAANVPLAPYRFERREPGSTDVQIEIDFCGVCHSDLHTVRGEWEGVHFPIVPGHEIVGRVAATGDDVTRFAPGDRVGVGVIVDSCRRCDACRADLQQHCEQGMTETYGSPEPQTGGITAGGYSNRIVVDERYVLRLADGVELAATAPLLCAGITTWAPLRAHAVGAGSKVGVVGLGGLGHVAVKLADALGAHVVVFTTSSRKAAAAKALGADEVVLSTDARQLDAHRDSLDVILDTVSAAHALDPYLDLLKLDGALALLGIPPEPHPGPSVPKLLRNRRTLSASAIGGIAETQKMLDFCAAHGIAAEIETIAIAQVDDAYDRMLRGDVRYRFVIDMATLPA
ncbi:MAG TPA: NAD(P)-dependent alcohol dehydrogenase [Conexibacter sp.]|nr:NAD(P)-dependent alcohol dehydrogenase [Conexibacter sp.]